MFQSSATNITSSSSNATLFTSNTGELLLIPALIAIFVIFFGLCQIILVFKLLAMTERVKNIDRNIQLLASKAADSNTSRYPQYGRNPRNDVQLPPDATQE